VGLAVFVKPRAAFAAALSFLAYGQQAAKCGKASKAGKALSTHLAFNKECDGGIVQRDRPAPCPSLPTKHAHEESQCFSLGGSSAARNASPSTTVFSQRRGLSTAALQCYFGISVGPSESEGQDGSCQHGPS